MILVGQLADGIFTPVVGLFSDKFDTRIGKRKPWYLAGTIVVPLCFFFVFEECFPCQSMSGTQETIVAIVWYCTFAALFNVGWASIQISHMSLIPSLTPMKETKDKLIGIRNGFTYISNITVLLLAFILINSISNPQLQFTILSVSMIAVGLVINICFILFIDEVGLSKIAHHSYRQLNQMLSSQGVKLPPDTSGEEEQILELPPKKQEEDEEDEPITWRDWVVQPQLYAVGAAYMLSRLSNNVATSMMPFYLTSVLHVGGVRNTKQAHKKTPWQIAIIPLCLYVGSTGMSFLIKKIGQKVSRKVQFVIGVVFTTIAALPMFFLEPADEYAMIPLAIVYGIGFSFTLNNSMGFVAAFVGEHGKSGAFVWGFISLFDKFSSGIALFLLTNLGSLDDAVYIRFAVAGVPLLASVVGGLSLICILNVKEFSIRPRSRTLSRIKK